MAVKLVNMLCVTIFTKDNCIFRHHDRKEIEVLRAGVQVRHRHYCASGRSDFVDRSVS